MFRPEILVGGIAVTGVLPHVSRGFWKGLILGYTFFVVDFGSPRLSR